MSCSETTPLARLCRFSARGDFCKHRAHGDAIVSEHTIVDAFSAAIHAEDLDALEADPDVASLSTDAVVIEFAVANRDKLKIDIINLYDLPRSAFSQNPGSQ